MDKGANNWFWKTKMKIQEGESKFKQTQLEGKKEAFQKPHQKQTLCIMYDFKE